MKIKWITSINTQLLIEKVAVIFGTTDKQFLKEKSMPLTYSLEIQNEVKIL